MMMSYKHFYTLNRVKSQSLTKQYLSKSVSITACRKLTESKLDQNTVPDIPDFYKGKSVFITGGTGFMGKVLVERLLSTCPDIGSLYLLMRTVKGSTPDSRLQQLKDSQLFNVLRRKDPRQLDKIVCVAGDLTSSQLGLTEADQEQLKKVSVVFHVAASLRLDEPLDASVASNLRPTLEVLRLCDTIDDLRAFVYVSTCYSNSERKRVEEKVYPAPTELTTLLDLVKRQDLSTEDSKKLIGAKPNSYTFTKAMAESTVDRHGCEKYPTAVFRPAIVISTIRDPFPGWIENMNGPSGVIAGVSAGVLRVFAIRKAARADLVPVDLSIDTLIAAAWEVAVDKPGKVRVYNCANNENPVCWGRYVDATNKHAMEYPSKHVVWWPHFYVTTNRYLYAFLEWVIQTIPITAMGYTAKMLRLKSGKILLEWNDLNRRMNASLRFFSSNEWQFVNDNVTKLSRRLSERDRAVFNLDPNTINWEEQLRGLVEGTRRYVLREGDDSLEGARARVRRFALIIKATKGICILALLNTLYINCIL